MLVFIVMMRDTGLDEFESWLEDDAAVIDLQQKFDDIFDWPPDFRGFGRNASGHFRVKNIVGDEGNLHRIC